jgi:hypothetical protein
MEMGDWNGDELYSGPDGWRSGICFMNQMRVGRNGMGWDGDEMIGLGVDICIAKI